MTTKQNDIPNCEPTPLQKQEATAEAESQRGFWGLLASKFLKGKGLISTFLRSIVSSQVASWADLGTSIGLVALGVSTWAATPIGAFIGGVVNCCINYKFTFRADGCSKRAVAVKYLMIWLGSLILNTVGTALLASVFDHWHLLESLGWTDVGSYAAARLIVSLLVSWFWNFVMQKNFVYVPTKFDPYAIRMVDFFSFRHNK